MRPRAFMTIPTSTSSRAITRQAHAAARGRPLFLVAENEPQHVRMVRALEDGGFGLDALWNDDFHHSAVVAVTGRQEAYYSDHRGTPQELVSAAKYGYLFQGQRYAWQKQPRGTPTRGLPPSTFVNFIENHDQVANSGDGSSSTHAHVARPVSRDCGADAADARHADDLSRAGIRRDDAVPLLRGSQRGTGRGGTEGTQRIPCAVSQPRDPGNATAGRDSGR